MVARTDKYGSDEGFSVVEVVVAASLLFFVLTAIVGLVGVSTQMTVQAKQKSILTNAVASYVDEVRSYSWEDIESADSDGDTVYVPSTQTRVIEGVSITFETTVENKVVQGDEFMKNVRVTAVAVLGGQSQTYTTRIALRNPNYNRTLAVDPDNPTIVFESPTPADNEVLFFNERFAGGVIRIRTTAESPVGTIAQVRYEVAGRLLRDQIGGGGADALFAPNPPTASVVSESYWDTRQEGVVDGIQTVIATAEDNQLRTANARRQYIVDNENALAPGTPVLQAKTSRAIDASWTAGRDGGSDATPYWASQYRWELSKEPTEGAASLTDWVKVASETVSAGTPDVVAIRNAGPIRTSMLAPNTVTPLGRYWSRVRSGSPRGNFINYTDSGFVVTRPEIYCLNTPAPFNQLSSTSLTTKKTTGNPKWARYAVNLWVSKPSFPTASGSTTWTVQYSVDRVTWLTPLWGTNPTAGNWMDVVDTTSNPYADKIRFNYQDPDSSGKNLWFRVVITTTPSGPGGGSPVTVTSNAAGPTSTVHNATAVFDPYGF